MKNISALTVLFLIGISFSQISWSHQFTCTRDGVSRHISVEHEPGREVPCQVKYEKPDEGDVSYPWNAQQDPDYCREKAKYLANRLGSFGWECVEIIESEDS
ncbi:MAG TPA: hypothetical protein QF517_09760 [Pseudomonadales bacterium]|jgi:hypothetical protein|nr:hypothetical protein [Pseudomonadales bacterium]MDP6314720.1 hypothetical protein [Pseudomonadales bacterium]MDP7313283.1 hypothetical protein [Pseudomonadales bacterium]MDP7575615.1 hypothetical protein [Pseudomonadales bacterium]HJL62231.1 hypothetical protein [Pseudomonadales bacterium]|tara:strand:+ start:95 stop:400 length:306 start_codon:yes stop_codon:yes gene_type:complete